MIEQTLTIKNKLGLHARASAKLVQLLQQYSAQVNLELNGQNANGKSMMGVMMLAASKGCKVLFTIKGKDERACFAAIQQLLDNCFDEQQ